MKPNRNSPCPCGSGKKYKHCCEGKQTKSAVPTARDFDPLVKLFNERRYAELEAQAQALLDIYPQAPFAWQLLGGALQMQGKDATAAFQMVASLSPEDPEAHFNLGVAYKSVGLTDQAIISYRRAVALNPQYIVALSNLGSALQDVQQYEEAVSYYRQALAVQPGAVHVHNKLGILFKQMGQTDEAIACYRRALSIKPDFVDAHYNLANLLKDLGQFDEAARIYERASSIRPDMAEIHANLGATLSKQGQHEQAIRYLRRAVEIAPGFAEAHYNLGNAYGQTGRWELAEQAFRQALQVKPDFVEAHNSLGFTLRQQGRLDEAADHFRQAIVLNPNFADAHGNLGGVLKIWGEFTEALACYRKQAQLDPGNAGAQYQVAALAGENTERAPEQYVASLFDGYAEKFDHSLVQDLKYSIPGKMAARIRQVPSLPLGGWSVLDLGCGTGLMAVEVAAWSGRMVGVDLSQKMLAKAAERDLYQRLECADLLAMMSAEPATSYDVIIAADVFVYVGKLDEICREAKRLLAPHGVFAFSLESPDAFPDGDVHQVVGAGYQLQNTGRYLHRADYLNGLAADNGFRVLAMEPTLIRMERGQAINGFMLLWAH